MPLALSAQGQAAVSEQPPLADEQTGLEEVGGGVWNLVYYRTLLGRIDDRTGQITGV